MKLKTSFWERRRFFDAHPMGPNRLDGRPPEKARMTCPCCGFPTLGEWGAFEICTLCNWEDDGQDDADADLVRGGPNQSFSLVEARENFERYLVKYPPDQETRVGGPDSQMEKKIKRAMIEDYECMMESPSAEELQIRWMRIVEREKLLYQELRLKLNGHLSEEEPCPYCGGQLRSQQAKQCRHCGKDCHDPDQVVPLNPVGRS